MRGLFLKEITTLSGFKTQSSGTRRQGAIAILEQRGRDQNKGLKSINNNRNTQTK